jgi:hypothetical protein
MKHKGTWTKTLTATALLCACLALGFGFHQFHQSMPSNVNAHADVLGHDTDPALNDFLHGDSKTYQGYDSAMREGK